MQEVFRPQVFQTNWGSMELLHGIHPTIQILFQKRGHDQNKEPFKGGFVYVHSFQESKDFTLEGIGEDIDNFLGINCEYDNGKEVQKQLIIYLRRLGYEAYAFALYSNEPYVWDEILAQSES